MTSLGLRAFTEPPFMQAGGAVTLLGHLLVVSGRPGQTQEATEPPAQPV